MTSAYEPIPAIVMTPADVWQAHTERVTDAVRDAARHLGDARAHEMALEDGRAAQKRVATLRIMEKELNPLTGKAHSASSAEAVVETDPEYRAYRKRQSDAVIATEVARGDFYAARLRAEFEVAKLRAEAAS